MKKKITKKELEQKRRLGIICLECDGEMYERGTIWHDCKDEGDLIIQCKKCKSIQVR